MKFLKYILIAVIGVTTLTLSSCNDDDYSIGTPFNKVEATVGEWSVRTVTLVNEENETMDITSYFNFSTFKLALNDDNTFTISGDAPNYTGITSGTWALDNNEAPMALILTGNQVTSQFAFVAPPRKGTNLNIRFDRKAGEDVIASYVYELTKK